ncbi:MAG TPA: O-antigen ligase family protein [Edaphobacter sp.]|nr:O-antigen ligase family protein [Edaphobacter sp.]
MTLIRPSLAQKKYPIRYWSFVAYAVGVPNFVRFDASGRTHQFGLFNPTSISTIILTLTCAFLLASVTILGRRRILLRRVDFSAWLWIALLINLTIASVLQPNSSNRPPVASDLPLSLYRLAEWVLGFAMLLSLYTREDEDRAIDLIVRLIGAVCWVNIAIVWMALPIVPSLVYAEPGDIAGGHARLGGALIHPVHLSVLAGVAFFHALLFFQGRKRFFCCFIAVVTLLLTYSRSEQIVFLIALFTYLMILSRKLLLRMLGSLAICTIAAGAIVFQGKILDYLERGQGMRNITTLSERTDVWKASFRAFWLRPYIGYGYIAGVKQALHDQWNATNWIPPHSHSEVIQALVSGGILAGLLILALYFRVLFVAFRSARQSVKHTFLLIVLIQIVTMSIIMPLVTVQFGRLSALFLMCFVGLVADVKMPARVRQTRMARVASLPTLQWPNEV